MKKGMIILFLTAVAVFRHLPAHAEIDLFSQEIFIEQTNDALKIHRELDLRRRQANEITRGNDLARAVKNFIRRTKDALTALKFRQSDQIRGAELIRIVNDNAKDILRRNKFSQQLQRRLQKDRMRALKDRNRDLHQRIKDLSRR